MIPKEDKNVEPDPVDIDDDVNDQGLESVEN